MSSVNARVPPLRLMAVDTPSDGQLPSYQSSSGQFEWVDDSSGGTPGGSNNEIQFNNSGAFDGDAGLLMSVKGDGDSTKIQVGNLKVGAAIVETAATNGFVTIACDGTGQIFLQSGNGAGGTWTDSIVNIISNANTNNAQLKFRDNTNTDNGSITLDSSGDLVLNNNVANKDIDLKILGTGQVEIANQTTDNDTTLSIKGNGTGDAKINLNNPTKAVTLICDTNQKLKVQGGVNSFVFDASSGTGGITWPDGTTQTSAASGGASAIGDLSDATTPATDNVGLGTGALSSITPTSGNYNVALGRDAGLDLTTGDSNVYIGYRAGMDNTTKSDNIGIGNSALKDSTGQWNVAIGKNAGINAGNGNVVIGRAAASLASAYTENVIIGTKAATSKGSFGTRNVILGHEAFEQNSGGDYNTGLGMRALRTTTGDYNISVGYLSGDNITTGNKNVVIGGLDVTSATGDSQLMISNGDGTQKYIEGDSSGSCFQGDNASTWSTTSDERLKENIVDSSKGLKEIKQLEVKNFNYISKAIPITEERENEEGEIETVIVGYDGDNIYGLDPEPTRTGFIAQEIEQILPECVKTNAQGHKTVDIDPVIYSLVNAVKELSQKVEDLEAQLG